MPVVRLSILAANEDILLVQGFNRIEIWQSVDLGNTYQEITAVTEEAAKLTTIPANNTFRMGGKLLKLMVNGAPEVSIAFSSLIDNWTPTQVRNRINEVVVDLATLSGDGKSVILTSPTTGRASSLEITYNDASDLGLPVQKVYGKAMRLPIVSETLIYQFDDPVGGLEDRYKWRFSFAGIAPISAFSAAVFGKTAPILDPEEVSVCTATFLGLDGVPQKRTVIVALQGSPIALGGYTIADEVSVIHTADELGFLQFSVVRGAKVRVAVEGTTFVREFVVPDLPTFDLLSVMATAPDPFTVQTPLPFLVRRTV